MENSIFYCQLPIAYDSSLVRDVLQIFARAVFASIRRRAGIAATNRKARCGAVGFIQRFSDALNLDPHFHLMALDGIYIDDGRDNPVFRRVGPPADAEVARVAERVHRRVLRLPRLMAQRGHETQTDPEEADTLRRDHPLLAELYGASITGRVATGPRAGRCIARVGDGPDSGNAVMKSEHCCAMVEGFSVHAGVCVPARDRARLERLAALVPPPRFNVTRYYGVLAPAASFRSWIVPKEEAYIVATHSGCRSGVESLKTDLTKTNAKRGWQPRNYSWCWQSSQNVFI